MHKPLTTMAKNCTRSNIYGQEAVGALNSKYMHKLFFYFFIGGAYLLIKEREGRRYGGNCSQYSYRACVTIGSPGSETAEGFP